MTKTKQAKIRKAARKPSKKLQKTPPKSQHAEPVQAGQEPQGDQSSKMPSRQVSEDELEHHFFPEGRFPKMETIARIASPHLSGDNYAEAIHKALMLLTYAEQAIQEEIDFQTISPMLSRCNERINYKRGVREITGQTRPGRAVEYFQNFLATRLSKERAHLPQDKRRLELVRQLDEYETSGFNGGDLESLREEFKFSRMQRNKKRRHRKKIL